MARASPLATVTWLAVAAAVLVLLVWQGFQTRSAARAVLTSAEDLKEAERAYVSIQYRQNSDDWPEDFFRQCESAGTVAGEEPLCYHLHLRIANSGQTPAHIEGGGIQTVPFMDETPFTPPVRTPDGRGEISPTFLDARTRYAAKFTYHLTPIDLKALTDSRLWLVGYVDYVDVFGARHRAGFCRRIGPREDSGNNVLLDDSTCGPYDQDRPIGERAGQLARR
jgi:hypothetical protein